MKFTSLLPVLAALVAPVVVCADDASDPVAPFEMLYYWTVYDLDVAVWGVHNGYIATNCLGSGKGKRCSFNEFVNFIVLGDASDKPSYYDMSSDYAMAPGDVMVIVGTLEDKLKTPAAAFDRLVRGRRSAVGVWNDLGFAVDKGSVEGAAKDIGVDRLLKNARTVLGAVSEVRASILHSNIRAQLVARVKDVVWQTVQRESAFVGKPWQEIEWEKTVEKYPDMKDPNSRLFKEVTEALDKFYQDKTNAKDLTIKQKVERSIASCFK